MNRLRTSEIFAIPTWVKVLHADGLGDQSIEFRKYGCSDELFKNGAQGIEVPIIIIIIGTGCMAMTCRSASGHGFGLIKGRVINPRTCLQEHFNGRLLFGLS